jgi:NADH-quinone oxidoreductase subunit N
MTASDFVLSPIVPEFVLTLGTLALILIGAFYGARSSGLVTIAAVVILGVTIVLVASRSAGTVNAFHGAFIDDAFARFMKILALGGSIVTLLMSGDWLRRERIEKFEYPVLVLLSTIGMLVLISANNLIALYLGLELMSLALYVVAAFHRDNVKASEAGLKYFVLGALSSGMLLYGASLLYGFAGTVSFTGIASVVHQGGGIGVIFGLSFLMVGLAFKISAVPFHMWTPDVYEGAPTPVTAFFAAAPKMAAMAVTTRVIIVAFPGITADWQQIIIFISLASMALGSFAAIGQTNIKRLMAYSSIGHMGFALVGLAAGTAAGVQGVILYMAIYLVMTLGSFAAILEMRRNGKAVEEIADLAGLSATDGPMALFLATMMFSLAGIPPLAGFFGKFYVFSAAVSAHLYALAVIGVVLSVVGAYYYLRIVKIMYFDAAQPAFDRASRLERLVLAVSAIGIVLFSIFPGAIVQAAAAAAASLFP